MDRMQAYLDRVQGLIDKHGWAIQGVSTVSPVVYTVGLTQKFGLPEFVVCGLNMQMAQDILNDLAEAAVARTLDVEEGRDYDNVFKGFNARFRWLTSEETQELRIAQRFAGERTVQAWQLLWPDPAGKFPNEGGVSQEYAAMQNLQLLFEDEEGPAH